MTLLVDNWRIRTKWYRMYKWLFANLLIVASLLCTAQEGVQAILTFQNPFEIPSGEELVALKATSTASPLLITTKPGILYLRPIDIATGTPKKVLSIKSNDEKRILKHEVIGDSIFCLVKSTENDRSITFESVVYTMFNDQLAEAARHPLSIKNLPNQRNAETLFFSVDDRAKFSAAVRLVGYEISPDALIELDVIDYKANRQSSFNLPIPYGADDVKITQMDITDEGIVYFTATAGMRLNSPFLKKNLFYSFNTADKELREFDINKDKVYHQEMLAVSNQEQINLITTFSSDPMLQAACHGNGWVEIDSNGAYLSKKAINEFSPEVKSALRIDSRSSQTSIEHLFIDDIYNLDGQVVGLFHQQYRDQVCTTDPRTGILSCTDQFHHDGIIVHFSSNEVPTVVINRSQLDFDQEGPYLGYTSALIDQAIILLYNDHEKNSNIFAEREMSNPSRANLRYVYIESNGKYRSNSLDLDLGRGFVLLPKVQGFEKYGIVHNVYCNGKDFRLGLLNTQLIQTTTD